MADMPSPLDLGGGLAAIGASRLDPSATDGGERPPLPFDVAGVRRLEVLCARPIHHVVDYRRIHGLALLLSERAPAARLRLWTSSALAGEASYARLPLAETVPFPWRGGVDLSAPPLSRLQGDTLLVAGDPSLELRLRARPGVRLLGSIPIDQPGAPLDRAAESAARGFGAALRAASPRWLGRPAGEGAVRLPPEPRFLLYQARHHLGDALWLTPLVRELGRRYPGARVEVIGSADARRALARNPRVDQLHVVEPADPAAGPALLARLAGRRYDAAISAFARRAESGWLARGVAELGVPCRINLEYFDPAYDPGVLGPCFTHEAWFFWGALPSPVMLLHALDPLAPAAAGSPSPERSVEFPTDPAAARLARELLAARGMSEGRFVVVAPGGRSSTRWPPERFGRLAARLAGELGVGVLVEGAPDEAELLAEVARGARLADPDAGSRVVACPDPLEVLAVLLGLSALLVANDNAAIHLAEVTATPTLYFAEQRKLVHSHPSGPACWALYDDLRDEIPEIPVAAVMAAVVALRERGLLARGAGAGRRRR